MKRIWIGIGLLVVILIAGIWVAETMENIQKPNADDLRRASQLALEEQWPLAEALTKRARDTWEKKWHLTASVANHAPMDEIDGLFAQLKVYAKVRDQISYSGTCAYLAERIEAMGHEHAFHWWNLL